jgi:protein-tyrosine-phosphatase
MGLAQKAAVHAALGDETRLIIVGELELGDRTFQELGTAASLPGNLLAHHLDVLEQAGLIGRQISEGDRRRRYISLNSQAIRMLFEPRAVSAHSVLFVCTHNSARSQYAAEAWRRRTGRKADSAGTHPAKVVNQQALKVALEMGVDLKGRKPKGYDRVKGNFDLVVSVCDRAREAGTPFDVPHLHWSVPDPVMAGTLGSYRSAFEAINGRIDRLAGPGAA